MSYYHYKDMTSYVNVDPSVDWGQSFMDSGAIYFKDGSFVLTNKSLAFHNGATFCVAPIVREDLKYHGGPGGLETVSGFSVPRSGTVDFWAVGTGCCGADGEDF